MQNQARIRQISGQNQAVRQKMGLWVPIWVPIWDRAHYGMGWVLKF